MSANTLGEIAFNAYNEARGGVTHDGKPTPPWSELGEPIRSAWETAALAVAVELRDEAPPEAPPSVTVKLTDGDYMHESNARAFWERMFEGAVMAMLTNAKAAIPEEGSAMATCAKYADLALKAWRERFKST